jgi:hypothetical protein
MESAKLLELSNKMNGGGINTSIPMTRRKPVGLSKKQLWKDSQIAKELIYCADVLKDLNMEVRVFIRDRYRLSDQRYWELLKAVWIGCGSVKTYPIFRQLFESKRPFRQFLMSPEEEAFLRSLPSEITVFRAVKTGSDSGISWSLSREVCERMAKADGRSVIQRVVNTKDCLAYFNRRGEDEIIYIN